MNRARRYAATTLALALAGCGRARVADEDVVAALRARRLVVPVVGVRPADVPDGFDELRGGRRRHGAIDIPAPRGTPVVSADDGVVLAVRVSPRGGRTVYATDPDRRFVYYYAHLDRWQPSLRAGTALARGDPLGAVGATGNADRAGPHLHFQVMVYPPDGHWWRGRPIDPRPFFATSVDAR